VEESNYSMLPGSYAYETFVRGNVINRFNKLEEKYILLTDSALSSADLKTYENFAKLKRKIQSSINTISIMGKGLYIDKQLTEITIDVNINYTTIGEVNSLAQIIAQEISTLFNKKVSIQVIIKNENKVEAIISKDSAKTKSKIFIIN
jgi:protein involved in sex pheromone biosynthesis